jgi:CRP/FNR family transcriptional regulator, cyclic AMP receptor protein
VRPGLFGAPALCYHFGMAKKEEIRKVVFHPGDVLFRENDNSFQFYIIQEGVVEVFKDDGQGGIIMLAEAGEGNSIGEFAMIDRLPRSATARAKTYVKTIEVTETGYQRLLDELPEWAVSVMRGLVERLRHANEIIRRTHSGDPQTDQEISSAEYDPEASSITKTPYDFDDTPDLA